MGEAASGVTAVASKAVAAAKGPLHAIRGTGEAEKMLKNARTEYRNEFEEIGFYTGIESLAETVGDKETAKLARSIRREEERMAKFLEKQIAQLAKAVAREEIPAAERNGGARRSSRRRSSSSSHGRSRARRERSARTTPTLAASRARPSRSRSNPRARGPAGTRGVPGRRTGYAWQRRHPQTGRDETEKERLDRNLEELLGELRVALPGVQVLFAFLLVVPFNQRFADITTSSRRSTS